MKKRLKDCKLKKYATIPRWYLTKTKKVPCGECGKPRIIKEYSQKPKFKGQRPSGYGWPDQ